MPEWNLILFDDGGRQDLLPLTFTRPCADIRTGILTIREKWEHHLGTGSSTLTQDYLQGKFPLQTSEDNLLVNGRALPASGLVGAIQALGTGESLQANGTLVAARLASIDDFDVNSTDGAAEVECQFVDHVWDIFRNNAEAIAADFEVVATGESQELPEHCLVTGEGEIYIAEGASIEGAILNPSSGPIYIGKDAHVMEGSMIRGPFALCEGSEVKMGAKIYGPTTIGPFSKVGGELNNVVVTGYSNKGHDGFLGNSVIGEWCNLGADTNSSNLKNNYEETKVWHYGQESFVPTGSQFCGLIMGDHSKSGINTMFNTATVVGVSSNIFGSGFPRTFIPSFSWGGASGVTEYKLDKALQTAEKVMERRGVELTENDKAIFKAVHASTAQWRKD